MGLVIFLIVLGVFFLVAELVFLPGAALGVILSLASYAGAAYIGFMRMGMTGGFAIIAVIVALSLIATIISLRAKTWQRFALNSKVEGICLAYNHHHTYSQGGKSPERAFKSAIISKRNHISQK